MNVFVYGSLMDMAEIEKVFPDYTTIILAKLEGYVRDFSKASWSWGDDENEDVGVLSIREADDEWCNGLLVTGISEESFEAYVEREGGYSVEQIPTKNVSLYSSTRLSSDVVIYTAIRSPERVLSPDGRVPEKYKQLCYNAAKEYGDKFYTNFKNTTYTYYTG